jgi:hypothetical protein
MNVNGFCGGARATSFVAVDERLGGAHRIRDAGCAGVPRGERRASGDHVGRCLTSAWSWRAPAVKVEFRLCATPHPKACGRWRARGLSARSSSAIR